MAMRNDQARDVNKYIIKKQYDKAIAFYQDHIQKNPWDINAIIRLADVFGMAGRKDKAVDMYKAIADHFVQDGSLLKAIGINKKIMRLDQSRESTYIRISELYEKTGQVAPKMILDRISKKAQKPARSLSAEIAVAQVKKQTSAKQLAEAISSSAQLRVVDPEEDRPSRADEFDDFTPEDLSFLQEQTALADANRTEGRTPLLSELSVDEFAMFSERMEQKTYNAGETIIRQGDEGSSMYFIVEGKASVSMLEGDTALSLATLRDGDIFGELSLVAGKPRNVTVVAESELEVLELTRQQLDEIVAEYPRVTKVLTSFYDERVSQTEKAMREALQKAKE